MDWIREFKAGSRHVYTIVMHQSVVLSFVKLTNPKLEEQNLLKTLNNKNKMTLTKLGSGFSNPHSALQQVLSVFFELGA